jgi:hypothetical protein
VVRRNRHDLFLRSVRRLQVGRRVFKRLADRDVFFYIVMIPSVDTKCVPMPTHLGGLQDRVKQESSKFPKPQQAGLVENEPRRASQFDPVIDKGKGNVKLLNLPACYQTVPVYVAIR